MAKKNEGRAVWFRMFRNIRNLVDAVPDESAGAALKAVFAYFDTGELPTNLDTLGYALFLSIKPAVDESNEDYKRAVESGRKGSQKRWEGEDRPPIPSLTSPIAPLTEEETETKKEIDKNIYQETDPPLRSLPKALVAEMDFNERRERAIEKLRNYIA